MSGDKFKIGLSITIEENRKFIKQKCNACKTSIKIDTCRLEVRQKIVSEMVVYFRVINLKEASNKKRITLPLYTINIIL